LDAHIQLQCTAVACLVTGMQRRDHINPVLRQLHLLPVH